MWYDEVSKDSDVVISTRVRYARNIKDHKFPHMLNNKQKEEIIQLVENAIDKNKYQVFRLNNMDKITKGSLAERHLISKEMIDSTSGGIIANEDYRLVAMVNEEDHLRIQAFESGFNVDKCYERLKNFTDHLEEKIEFAESEKYGYITSCPTCIGSGLRISVMLHLPGLAKLHLLNKLLEQAVSIGLSVRGIYGENTNGYGFIYQVSNRKTLGISDEEIVNNIKMIIHTIIEQERNAREILLKNSSIELEIEVYRAYGILKNARMLEEEEMIKLLSQVRLGIAMKLIPEVSLEKIHLLMNNAQSYSLSTIIKEELDEKMDEIERAKYVREELNK